MVVPVSPRSRATTSTASTTSGASTNGASTNGASTSGASTAARSESASGPSASTASLEAPAGASGTPASSSAVDRFEPAPRPGLEGAPKRGGLPDELLRTERARVTHGTDPGDFYCEHMFFTTQREATAPGSEVGTNERGERLVGFLHLPPDAHTWRRPPAPGEATYTQAERHAGTRDVVGAALRGYFPDALRAAKDGPVRIQLGGYEAFQSVRNNPTGDFVLHRENLDAAMQRAFGRHLLAPEGERLPREEGQPDNAERYRYRVTDPATGKEREVVLQAQSFPVTDDAIDGQSARSAQAGMQSFRPHAVISMGVASGDSYRAEFHADDGGLVTDGGRQSHDDTRAPRQALPDNYSLGRAIYRGSQPEGVPVSTLLTGGPGIV